MALGGNSTLDSNKGFLKFPISGLNHNVRVSSKDLLEEHFMSLLSLFLLVFEGKLVQELSNHGISNEGRGSLSLEANDFSQTSDGTLSSHDVILFKSLSVTNN